MKKTSVTAMILALSILGMVLFAGITIYILKSVRGDFKPSPPLPEITHGEFPISLEYEVDGKYHKYEDVLICDFDGIEFVFGLGEKRRKWSARLKSGNDEIPILKTNDDAFVYFPVGLYSAVVGEAFMDNNEEESKGVLSTFPDALRKVYQDTGKQTVVIVPADELYEKYKIRLIAWEYAPPIKNTFK